VSHFFRREPKAIFHKPNNPWQPLPQTACWQGLFLTKAAPELRISLCDALSRLDEKA
jgi:hypothetical protein